MLSIIGLQLSSRLPSEELKIYISVSHSLLNVFGTLPFTLRKDRSHRKSAEKHICKEVEDGENCIKRGVIICARPDTLLR